MPHNRADFDSLIGAVIQRDDLEAIRPVIEKELIHYEILDALNGAGALRNLVFQGGTSLRLCYGSGRYSEDLDFAGGPEFANIQMQNLADLLQEKVAKRYGLTVSVKPPKHVREEPVRKGINVDAWQVSVETRPDRPDIKKQRIKLEIANVTAHTRDLMRLQNNYPEAPAGYDEVLIGAESMEEIMADKLVSLPAVTSHVRNRDIWDLLFLAQRRATPNMDFIAAKAEEYGVENYPGKVDDMIERLPEIVSGAEFQGEMSRFLPPAVVRDRLSDPDFRSYLTKSVVDLLETVSRSYDPDQGNDDKFRI